MPSRPQEEQTRTAPLGLRIQPWLKEELAVLARQHDRKLANYIEIVLKAHVAEQRWPAAVPRPQTPSKTFRDRKPHGTKRAN